MDRRSRRASRRVPQRSEPSRSDDSRLRLVGVAVLCMKVGLVPLAFDHSADRPFVVFRALLSHGLTYVLIGVLLGLVVLNAPSIVTRSRIHIPVLIFFAVGVLAAIFAVNPTLAFFGTHDRMLGLNATADGVVTYFAAVNLVRSRRDVTALLLSLLAASVVVIAYEAIQLSGRDPFSWSIDGSLRPFSTLGQPTTLGLYLVTVAAFVLAFGLLTPVLRRPIRVALIAYAGVVLLAAGLTGTRSVALGAATGAAVFVALVWLKHPSSRARRLSLMSGLAASAVLAVLLLATPLGARFAATVEVPAVSSAEDSTFPQLEESASTRLVIYQMALGMVVDRPVLGYGPDNFAAGVPAYRPDPAPVELRTSIATSAHSWITAIASSTGIAGLLAFTAILIVVAVAVLRAPFSVVTMVGAIAAATYLGAGLTTVNALETDTLFWLAIAGIAGATAAPGQLLQPATSEHVRRRARSASISRRVVAWSLVLAAVLLAATGVTAWGASRLAKQSVSVRTPATSAVAIDLASRATQADPERAEYWKQLALAYAAASRWADASTAFKHGAKLAPYDIRFLTDDVQVQLVLANAGDGQAIARATDLADRAVRIDPNNPRAHLTSAGVAHARGDPQSAARSVDRALALDPSSTNTQLYATATQIYLSVGRFEDAIRVGNAGVALLGSTRASVPLMVAVAQALAATGRTADALVQLDTALRISPGDQAALRLRDQLLAR